MSFREILKTLTEKTGATGSAILAGDGELVDAYPPHDSKEHADISLIGAHHGIILGIAKDACSRVNRLSGETVLCVWTKKAKIAIVDLMEGYYLILILKSNIPMGKTAMAARNAARLIVMELAG